MSLSAGTVAAARSRRARTHCKRKHPLSGHNLYVDPHGKRRCKTCRRDEQWYRTRGLRLTEIEA